MSEWTEFETLFVSEVANTSDLKRLSDLEDAHQFPQGYALHEARQVLQYLSRVEYLEWKRLAIPGTAESRRPHVWINGVEQPRE